MVTVFGCYSAFYHAPARFCLLVMCNCQQINGYKIYNTSCTSSSITYIMYSHEHVSFSLLFSPRMTANWIFYVFVCLCEFFSSRIQPTAWFWSIISSFRFTLFDGYFSLSNFGGLFYGFIVVLRRCSGVLPRISFLQAQRPKSFSENRRPVLFGYETFLSMDRGRKLRKISVRGDSFRRQICPNRDC